MTRTPRKRYANHVKNPENSFIVEFRKKEDCPNMTITYACRASLPLLGAFALETSIIACSGTSLANRSPKQQPAQTNSISGNIPNIIGRMRITMRRPAFLRWFYIGKVMASRDTSVLPAKHWSSDSRYAAEHDAAWKIILGDEIAPLLLRNGFDTQTFTKELFQPQFRSYIKRLEEEQAVSIPDKYQIRSRGKVGGVEKRMRAVLQLLEASRASDSSVAAGKGLIVWKRRTGGKFRCSMESQAVMANCRHIGPQSPARYTLFKRIRRLQN
jgi:hypothetical protein